MIEKGQKSASLIDAQALVTAEKGSKKWIKKFIGLYRDSKKRNLIDRNYPLSRFKIIKNNSEWDLCYESEPRVIRAIEENGVIVIGDREDPQMLVKFRGKMSGIPLRDIHTIEGSQFEKGVWYIPIGEIRWHLINNFLERKGFVYLDEGEWSRVRPIKDYVKTKSADIFNCINNKAESIPKKFPNDEIEAKNIFGSSRLMTRNNYIREYSE